MQDKLRPLSMVTSGETVKLVKIDAGHNLNSRLASMGLLPNVEITVVRNDHKGPSVISIKDSKIMLGMGVTRKIMVL
jgi:ferrous iron transport protein A